MLFLKVKNQINDKTDILQSKDFIQLALIIINIISFCCLIDLFTIYFSV